LDLFHSFGDFRFDVGLAGNWLSRWGRVELFPSGDGWLVDPVSADCFAEDVEGGLVGIGDDVGVIGYAASGHRRVNATAVGRAVYEEKSDVDGAPLAGVAGLRVAQLDVGRYTLRGGGCFR
jgi:hypothetical protein